uniref:Uncharacterized protein n=1 Tax=Oryza nivara TaxID=4536 RepID=A0A0E0FGM9_ORYNI
MQQPHSDNDDNAVHHAVSARSIRAPHGAHSKLAPLAILVFVSLLAAGATANNGYTMPSPSPPPPPQQHTPPAHSDKLLVRVEAELGETQVSDFYMGARACYVRLRVSPDFKCNNPTNINYSSIEGAPLRDEGKRWADHDYYNIMYATGPLAFRPAICSPKH